MNRRRRITPHQNDRAYSRRTAIAWWATIALALGFSLHGLAPLVHISMASGRCGDNSTYELVTDGGPSDRSGEPSRSRFQPQRHEHGTEHNPLTCDECKSLLLAKHLVTPVLTPDTVFAIHCAGIVRQACAVKSVWRTVTLHLARGPPSA